MLKRWSLKGLALLAVAACIVAGLTMQDAEERIWSGRALQCAANVDIELKGRIYRTCSELADRYHIGEYVFAGGFLILVVSLGLARLRTSRTSTASTESTD